MTPREGVTASDLLVLYVAGCAFWLAAFVVRLWRAYRTRRRP